MSASDPRTLIVVAHPSLHGTSRANRCWTEELERHPGEFLVHDIYEVSEQGGFTPAAVAAEQALLAAHDLVVLQFPVYWYSCPALLRAWADAVYAFGWAYGVESARPGEPGRALAGKRMALAVTVGDEAANYAPDRPVGYTLDQVLAPFYATARYLELRCEPRAFALYGCDGELSDAALTASAAEYLAWLRALRG